jgi:type II secretory pathway pseudopilin PulG
MKKSNGFTVVELLICLMFVVMLSLLMMNGCLNNRAFTEQRANKGAKEYIAKNGIAITRWSCAGDSDGDGYGTCNLVLASGEKIVLNCPTDYFDVNIWGASGCKEIVHNMNINGGFIDQ